MNNIKNVNINDNEADYDNNNQDISNIQFIENEINTDNILILKFDNTESKYNDYFHTLHNTFSYKIINITDSIILDFYDIESIPTIYIYKNKNLLDTIEGFHTKANLIKKIQNIISN